MIKSRTVTVLYSFFCSFKRVGFADKTGMCAGSRWSVFYSWWVSASGSFIAAASLINNCSAFRTPEKVMEAGVRTQGIGGTEGLCARESHRALLSIAQPRKTNIKINGKPYQILEDATAWRWDLGKSGKSERRVRILTKVSIAESLSVLLKEKKWNFMLSLYFQIQAPTDWQRLILWQL